MQKAKTVFKRLQRICLCDTMLLLITLKINSNKILISTTQHWPEKNKSFKTSHDKKKKNIKPKKFLYVIVMKIKLLSKQQSIRTFIRKEIMTTKISFMNKINFLKRNLKASSTPIKIS